MDFGSIFQRLTSEAGAARQPYPWQSALFQALQNGSIPTALDIPTGLGKTSVIAIWLIARALGAPVPRRLAYVVDRRAVVDQATAEAEALVRALGSGEADNDLNALRNGLGLADGDTLPVSTLRGQFADNRRWSDDPTVSAIVVGTVDMIGSRLLFEGYGVSARRRPVHAGLLACDTLVVLDEAHLCVPFLALLQQIAGFRSGRTGSTRPLPPPLAVMALTATGRGHEGGTVLGLSAADEAHPQVRSRLVAPKPLELVVSDGGTALSDDLAERAWALRHADDGTPRRVLIYADRRDTAEKIHRRLATSLQKEKHPADRVQMLVGARRVKERQALAADPTYGLFLGGRPLTPDDGPAFLVATSAGEVGVDLDADAMVADLVAFERMVQRLGRVNRRGRDRPAPIAVVAAPMPKEKPEDAAERIGRLRRPIEALRRTADGALDASIEGLRDLRRRAAIDPALGQAIAAATSPVPLRPELSRPLVEAWAMTSLDEHTGRPDIRPWLRGWEEDDEPQTEVIWRQLLPWRHGERLADPGLIERFFEAAPVHLSEILEIPVSQATALLRKRLAAVLKPADAADTPSLLERHCVILLDQKGATVGHWAAKALRDVLEDDGKRKAFERQIIGKRLVLQADLGGLGEHGLASDAVADRPATLDGETGDLPAGKGWSEADLQAIGYRVRIVDGTAETEPEGRWRRDAEFRFGEGDDAASERLVVDVWRDGRSGRGDRAISLRAQSLAEHQAWVAAEAERIAGALGLAEDQRRMLVLAATLHDEGKRRPFWQDAMGAPRAGRPFAKTARRGGNPKLDGYRHEFGSLASALGNADLAALPADLHDLALHLIAAHHGHARPVIPAVLPPAGPSDAADLPPSAAEPLARAAALRFAHLQKSWGAWDLAWWEAVFRAADCRASARLDAEPLPPEKP
ncbi:type I-U CRISPR-associated helicase/endonuclease Cas3 [Prosthecomicrobium hirschii]|uniref:type I-G CRISPR-associated helicase/endonuclease Cas3g n=1 Tax=Prosthecodimorpha hirschii TaxID=665126 RepID=UPI00221F2E7E|nr:type I-U CRISPR-associated helicase/endonuclease Cas3 [Prosthecomicrobium hirschii]MCW1840472.1 type I-U CRISPR-associated helicase/endonuclease Cas3 [Prosthecomicrobium hirschii]